MKYVEIAAPSNIHHVSGTNGSFVDFSHQFSSALVTFLSSVLISVAK